MKESDRKGISYCRKSITVKGMSDEQSVNYQQEAINRYAERNSITIVKQYSDVGYSGKNTDRPDLNTMLEDLESDVEQIDCLLLYSVDRLGRDLEGNVSTLVKVTEFVETVVLVSEQLTSHADYFKMFFLTLTTQAQAEREHLLLRMADGRKAKIMHRKSFNGSYLPLGYVKEKERLVPALAENTEDSAAIKGLEIIQFIFYSCFEGVSLRKIAERLDGYYGLTQRQTKWNHKSVRYILSNPVYIGSMSGTLRNNENYYIESANIEPLVDTTMFMIIQRRLKFVRKGRKTSALLRLPLSTLCLHCAEPLIQKKGQTTCPVCGKSVETKLLLQALHWAFEKVLKRQQMEKFHNQVERMVEMHQWKERKLRRRMEDLHERYEIIHHMSEYDVHAKKEMIRVNTSETIKAQQELAWIETVIKTFGSKDSEGQIKKSSDVKFAPTLISTRLIKLAYLTLVDLEAYEVEIVFHKDLIGGCII